MKNEDLLRRLEDQLRESNSEFKNSQEILKWAAKTLPLLKRVDAQLHHMFDQCAQLFNVDLSFHTLGPALETMKSQLMIAIEELKVRNATSDLIEEKYFPPGSPLDVQMFVSKILQLAKRSVWIYDPYMDEKIIEELVNIEAPEAKLLTKDPKGVFLQRLRAAKEQLSNRSINARKSSKSHDRFYIVDGSRVWSLGASYIQAGEKGTLIHEISKETEKGRVIKDFDDWWALAVPIECDSKSIKDAAQDGQQKRKGQIRLSDSQPTRPTFDVKEIENRIETTASLGMLKPQRLLILTAYPEYPAKLKTLFSSKPGSLKSILENPPKIRAHGFGMRVLGAANNIRGLLCRVTALDMKAIDLYKDGALIAALRADGEFLCWAMKDLVFNPIALIESIYNFVQLYEMVLRDMDNGPQRIFMRIDLRNLHKDGESIKLGGRDLKSIRYVFLESIAPAPDDAWDGTIDIDMKDYEVSKVAYYLAEMLYLYFGLDIEEIPYTKEINGAKSIDISGIIKA